MPTAEYQTVPLAALVESDANPRRITSKAEIDVVSEALFHGRIRKTETCWLWDGPPMKFGYGRASIGHRRTMLAHRLSYLLAHGELAAEDCVLHRCDVPACVRPDHLFLGDRGVNARDMAAKGRQFLQRYPRAMAGENHWMRKRPDLIRKKAPRVCIRCGAETNAPDKGRCSPCYSYFRRTGQERPEAYFANADTRVEITEEGRRALDAATREEAR